MHLCRCLCLLQYGLMSNLDVGTEHLRWMGDTRFLLGLLWVSVLASPGLVSAATKSVLGCGWL
jgi:hypothetical protein